MATHSSILAKEIPWTEEPDKLQSMGSEKSRTQLSNSTTTNIFSLDALKQQSGSISLSRASLHYHQVGNLFSTVNVYKQITVAKWHIWKI